MPLTTQSVADLTHLPQAERPRLPRPAPEPIPIDVCQLVGPGLPARPARLACAPLSLLGPAPTLLRHIGLLEVSELGVARSTDMIASDALRIQVYERVEVHERISLDVVRKQVSPVAGGEGAPRTDVLPYVNLILDLIEREQIVAARRMLDAAPPTMVSDRRVGRLRRVLAEPSISVSTKRDVDRRREYQWIRDNKQRYQGQWVALDEGLLLASAGSLRQLLEQLKPLRAERPPLLHHVQ